MRFHYPSPCIARSPIAFDCHRFLHRRSVLQTRAFTLLELLVVISIIALLIAILMPAISAARAAVNSTVCMSNLRQLGLSLRMYSDDFDQWFLAAGSPYPQYNSGTIEDRPWFELLYPYGPEAFLDYGFALGGGGYTDLGGNMMCPSEPINSQSRQYGLNWRMVGDDATDEPGTSTTSGPRRTRDVYSPWNAVWAGDTGWNHRLSNTRPEPEGGRMSYRHNHNVNMLHVDGRVQTYDRSQMGGANAGFNDHSWVVFIFGWDTGYDRAIN